MAGAVIRGRIQVTQKKDFMASQLTVGIQGSEQTYFRHQKSADNASLYLGKRPFINKSFPGTTYPDKVAPTGI